LITLQRRARTRLRCTITRLRRDILRSETQSQKLEYSSELV
jgi:hypothetical protein